MTEFCVMASGKVDGPMLVIHNVIYLPVFRLALNLPPVRMAAIARLSVSPRLTLAAARSIRPATIQVKTKFSSSRVAIDQFCAPGLPAALPLRLKG